MQYTKHFISILNACKFLTSEMFGIYSLATIEHLEIKIIYREFDRLSSLIHANNIKNYKI